MCEFDSLAMAQKFAKYAMTKFVRALLYVNKVSQQSSRSVWEAVPLEDFKEPWWSKTIAELMKNYSKNMQLMKTLLTLLKRTSKPNLV